MNIKTITPDEKLAAALAKKMLKAAGKERPEVIAQACLLAIQLICFVHEKPKGKL